MKSFPDYSRALRRNLPGIAYGLHLIALCAGLFAASRAAYVHATLNIGFCSTIECETVILGPFGRLLGVPMPLFGLLFYGGLLALNFAPQRGQTAGIQRVGYGLALTVGTVVSMILVALMMFVLRSHCSICLLSASAVGCAAITWLLIPASSVKPSKHLLWIVAIATTIVIVDIAQALQTDAQRLRFVQRLLPSKSEKSLLDDCQINYGAPSGNRVLVFMDLLCTDCYVRVRGLVARIDAGESFSIGIHLLALRQRKLSVQAALWAPTDIKRMLDFARAIKDKRTDTAIAIESLARSMGAKHDLKSRGHYLHQSQKLANSFRIVGTPTFVIGAHDGYWLVGDVARNALIKSVTK